MPASASATARSDARVLLQQLFLHRPLLLHPRLLHQPLLHPLSAHPPSLHPLLPLLLQPPLSFAVLGLASIGYPLLLGNGRDLTQFAFTGSAARV